MILPKNQLININVDLILDEFLACLVVLMCIVKLEIHMWILNFCHPSKFNLYVEEKVQEIGRAHV